MERRPNDSQLDCLWRTFKDYEIATSNQEGDIEHKLATLKSLDDLVIESQTNAITHLELVEEKNNVLTLIGKNAAGGEASRVQFEKSVYITEFIKYVLTQVEADKNIGKVGDKVYRITLSDGTIFYAPITSYIGKETDTIITGVVNDNIISANLKIKDTDNVVELKAQSDGVHVRFKIDTDKTNVKLEATENGLTSKMFWEDGETLVGFKSLTFDEYNALVQKEPSEIKDGILYFCSDEGVMYVNKKPYPDVSRFVMTKVYEAKIKELEAMDQVIDDKIAKHDEYYDKKLDAETKRATEKETELENKITQNTTDINTNKSDISEIQKTLESVVTKDENGDVTLEGKLKFGDDSVYIEKTEDGALSLNGDSIKFSSVPQIDGTQFATKQDIADLVASAPEELDTLKELADALQKDGETLKTIFSKIDEKVDSSDFEEYKTQVTEDIQTAVEKGTADLAKSADVDSKFEEAKQEAEEKYETKQNASETYQTKVDATKEKAELEQKITQNTENIEKKQDKLKAGTHISIDEDLVTISCDIKIEDYLKSVDASTTYETKTDSESKKSALEGKFTGVQNSLNEHTSDNDIHVPNHSTPNQFLMSSESGKGSKWQTIHKATKTKDGFMSKEYAAQLDLLAENGLKLTIDNITWGTLDVTE